MDLGQESDVKAVYYHPAYLTYAEYIIWNAGLDDSYHPFVPTYLAFQNNLHHWNRTESLSYW